MKINVSGITSEYSASATSPQTPSGPVKLLFKLIKLIQDVAQTSTGTGNLSTLKATITTDGNGNPTLDHNNSRNWLRCK